MSYSITIPEGNAELLASGIDPVERNAKHIIYQGRMIYSAEDIPLPQTLYRMVEDATGEWFEFGFLSAETLTGNSAAGFTTQGNYGTIEIEQSTDLVSWSLGKFIPATVPMAVQEDGTLEYWSRCTVPRYWKNVIVDLTVTSARYGKSITDIKVGGVTVALSYPYAMPAAAATLQADLRTAGYDDAVVSTVAADLSVEGINHVWESDSYNRDPIDLTFTGGNVTAASYDGSLVTLPSLPYAMPAAAATLQADLRTAGLTGAVIRLFDDAWTIELPDRSAAGLVNRVFEVTITPDDPHPAWDIFGTSLGDVTDNLITGTSGNIRPNVGEAVIPEADKQFARLAIKQGTRFPAVEPPLLTEATFAFLAIGATQRPRATGGAAESITERDKLITRNATGTVYYDQLLSVSYNGELPEAVAWASSNPNVATVDANGFLTHLTTGASTITASADGNSVSRVFNLTVGGAVTNTLAGYAVGSLAKHCSDAVDTRIDGLTAATMPLYTTRNHAGGIYVRNTACWAANLAAKLTCISPHNSISGEWRAGTAISPRHIVFAAHYDIDVGAVFRFVTADNTVVERTMTAKLVHPDYAPYFPDLVIGLLDSDLPETITPAKILPDNWATYLPSISNAAPIPAICLDREEKAIVSDLVYHTTSAGFSSPATLNASDRLAFHEDKITGDSGNPAFLIVNGELVLLTVWTYGGGGSGTAIQPQRAAINAMMASLGGGHTLQNADLSGFTSF